MEILHCIGIRHDITLKSEVGTQAVIQPILATLNRLAVVVVVRAHRAHQPCTLNNLSPRVHVNILDRVWRFVRVGTRQALARALTIRIYSEVLRSRGNLAILLQALYHLHTKLRNEEWVFAINLLVATPTLVATNIKNRSIDIGIAE